MIKNRILRLWTKFKSVLLPDSRHVEFSLISAVDDEPGRPSRKLIDIGQQIIETTKQIDQLNIRYRYSSQNILFNTWPGEHYKILKAICLDRKPDLVIEIGTFEGPSALALLQGMGKTSKLITFDIVPWQKIATTCLAEEDFKDGRLQQVISDLSIKSDFEKYQKLFEQADIIFLDGPKNIEFETKFLSNLSEIHTKNDLLLVIDDIRKWNMLKIWKQLDRPKLDFTSFGHWSGTGLVDWNGKLLH